MARKSNSCLKSFGTLNSLLPGFRDFTCYFTFCTVISNSGEPGILSTQRGRPDSGNQHLQVGQFNNETEHQTEYTVTGVNISFYPVTGVTGLFSGSCGKILVLMFFGQKFSFGFFTCINISPHCYFQFGESKEPNIA